MLTTNTKVKTPIGEGFVQGPFAVETVSGDPVVRGALVRLPVNDITRPHLNQSNCMTPHATISGLWVFQEKELS
jgi:hypothetical protein